jgi:protein tyrosine/serine phosphatase
MKNFHQVKTNLFRGGKPSLSDIVALKKKFNIKKIISLDEQAGEFIKPLCKKLDIEQIIIPLNCHDKNSVKYLLKHNIYNLIDEKVPTFVHCLHGKDRTGLFIGLVRCLLDKWNCKKAIKEAKHLGFGMRIDNKMEKFFIKLICQADKNIDTNNAYDIVTNTHDGNETSRDYTLDTQERGSWSPYADPAIRTYPLAFTDTYYTDNPEQTRENYGLKDINDEEMKSTQIPAVGVFDQNTQITNMVGPSVIGGGFV